MSVSVVIPCFGPRHYLEACLDALAETSPAIELYLVDNGTGYVEDVIDQSAIACHPDCLGVGMQRNETNEGFAKACNDGARGATSDVLLFLNVDCEPRSDWLAPLLAAFDDPKVGIAGSKLVYPDGRIQHAGIEPYEAAGKLEFREIREERPAGFVPGVTGACMAVRRECFEECGGFDEGYWNGYDDVDLCLTATSLGWLIRYEPESVVMHHTSATGPERWSRVAENVERLQTKWASPGVR